MDARTGGRFRFCMRAPDGADAGWRAETHEVTAPSKLVFTCRLINTTPTHDALWTVTLREEGGKTVLQLHQKLFELASAREDAKAGFLECLERLDALIARLSSTN